MANDMAMEAAPMAMGGDGGGRKMFKGGPAPELADAAPGAAGPPTGLDSNSGEPMQQVTRVRQEFPESWIWTDVVVNK